MKKILILLLLCAFVVPVFADDALVLPKGVMRFYIVPAFSMANDEFDENGDKIGEVEDIESIKLMTVGAAVEYGVTDWISVAVQWTPGWSVWSELEEGTLFEKGKLTGPFDIFAGAKVQLIGPKAPVANDTMRFCLAPGVKIPLPAGIDSLEEATKFGTSEEFILTNTDKHVLGLGGRAYFDYLLTEDFFINLYSELIYYPTEANSDDGGAQEFLSYGPDAEIAYGYDLTLEVEPSFWPWVAEGMQLKLGVPVTYTASPEIEVDGVGQDDASYVLSVAPSVALFTTVLPMPIEVKASYSLPLMGKEAFATNTIIVQLKGFLKF
jgi:hypothetical protein